MHCTINHYAKRYPPNPTTWIVRDCCWSLCSSTFDIRRIWCSLTYLRLSEPPRALEIRLPCFLTLLSIFLETLGEGVVGMTYILTNKEINEIGYAVILRNIGAIISRCQSPIANRQSRTGWVWWLCIRYTAWTHWALRPRKWSPRHTHNLWNP